MNEPSFAPTNPADAEIRRILSAMKCVAVMGFSANEDRASHGVARFLLGQGLKVIGVNPGLAGQTIAGIPVVHSLADVGGKVDVVDVFRRSDAAPEVVSAAISVGAGAVWLQEGVAHEEAAAAARAAGLACVQNRCIYQEWLRLMNG